MTDYRPALPLRTRARVRITRAIDQVTTHLIDHGYCAAAERLWHACGPRRQTHPRPHASITERARNLINELDQQQQT